MATKVKPTRLQITGVPQVGKVPTYVDKNTFARGNGGGGGGYGRFLSLWNCATGLPISFPEATPYTYLTGDYFLVEVVDSSDPATNYKPDGATYTGVASSTVESDSVAKGDVYVYDGTVWLLQSNSGKSVSFSNITGQPTDNLNLAADLNAKQDKSAIVTTLVGADNNHYPTAKAVTDAGYVTSSIINDTAFAASWDGDTTHAPTKNAVYDKIDAMDTTIAGKQDELVSAVNIRTINGTSILGSGDIPTPTGIPSQTGEAGKFLTTDGTIVSWGTVYSTITVTLLSAGWSSNTQTVTATGVTSSNSVIVSPSPNNISDYSDNGIYCSAQGTNSLTFTCSNTPSNDIVVNVIIMN